MWECKENPQTRDAGVGGERKRRCLSNLHKLSLMQLSDTVLVVVQLVSSLVFCVRVVFNVVEGCSAILFCVCGNVEVPLFGNGGRRTLARSPLHTPWMFLLIKSGWGANGFVPEKLWSQR